MDRFDLFGVTERFDESILILAHELKLTFCDILYIRSKDSHGSMKDGLNFTFIPHGHVLDEPQDVTKMVFSERFFVRNSRDYLIFNYANQALTHKIQSIGKEKFNAALKQYKKYLALASETCLPKKITTRILDVTKCYYTDEGCGYDCFDNICKDKPELNKRIF